ncbi:unnamed protein product, partial [Meganyctiphanes norvegica]
MKGDFFTNICIFSGNGHMLLLYEKLSSYYTGCDINERVCRVTKKKAPPFGTEPLNIMLDNELLPQLRPAKECKIQNAAVRKGTSLKILEEKYTLHVHLWMSAPDAVKDSLLPMETTFKVVKYLKGELKANMSLFESKITILLVYNTSSNPFKSHRQRGNTPRGGGNSILAGPMGQLKILRRPKPKTLKFKYILNQSIFFNKILQNDNCWSLKVPSKISKPPGFPHIHDASGTRLEGPIGPYGDLTIIRLICEASGSPAPSLVWGGVAAGQGSAVERRPGGSGRHGIARTVMDIQASRATAESVISCSTTNASASSGVVNTVSVVLKVNLPPVSVRLVPPSAWVSAGEKSIFRCRVQGARPEPIVQWWLAGTQLKHHTMLTTVSGNLSVSTVHLVPGPGDHGLSLVCKAFSVYLPDQILQDHTTLQVHFVPVAVVTVSHHHHHNHHQQPFGGIAPKANSVAEVDSGVDNDAVIGGVGVDVTVKEGDNLTLTCHLHANPPPQTFTWFHNGGLIQKQETLGNMVENKTLDLIKVGRNKVGLYTCMASNEEGDGFSNAVNINIRYAPVCSESNRQSYVTVNGAIEVECSVDAFPTSVTFSWTLITPDGHSNPLPHVGRLEEGTGRYSLTGLQGPHDQVQCEAANDAGKQKEPCIIDLYSKGRAETVQTCSVGNTSAASFTVSCQTGAPRGQRNMYHLQVHAQPVSNGAAETSAEEEILEDVSEVSLHHNGTTTTSFLGPLVANITNNQPHFLVRGLAPGKFTLIIRASNEMGVSPPMVTTAFLSKDISQPVIGSGAPGAGHEGSMAGSSNSAVAGTNDRTQNHPTSSVDGKENKLIPRNIFSIVPTLLVLVGSMVSIISVTAVVILLIRRRSARQGLQNNEQTQLDEDISLKARNLEEKEHDNKEKIKAPESVATVSGDTKATSSTNYNVLKTNSPADMGILQTGKTVTFQPLADTCLPAPVRTATIPIVHPASGYETFYTPVANDSQFMQHATTAGYPQVYMLSNNRIEEMGNIVNPNSISPTFISKDSGSPLRFDQNNQLQSVGSFVPSTSSENLLACADVEVVQAELPQYYHNQRQSIPNLGPGLCMPVISSTLSRSPNHMRNISAGPTLHLLPDTVPTSNYVGSALLPSSQATTVLGDPNRSPASRLDNSSTIAINNQCISSNPINQQNIVMSDNHFTMHSPHKLGTSQQNLLQEVPLPILKTYPPTEPYTNMHMFVSSNTPQDFVSVMPVTGQETNTVPSLTQYQVTSDKLVGG